MLNQLIEEQKKEFENELQKVMNMWFSPDEKKAVLCSFLTTSLTLAYKQGLKDEKSEWLRAAGKPMKEELGLQD